MSENIKESVPHEVFLTILKHSLSSDFLLTMFFFKHFLSPF